MEKQIEKLMSALHCTREEAIEVIEADKKIDKGEKLFELSPELEAGAKKARQADRKPTVYNFDTKDKKRKADEDKADLLNILFSAVLPVCDTYKITNGEREFLFTYHGKKYKVVLSAPRS